MIIYGMKTMKLCIYLLTECKAEKDSDTESEQLNLDSINRQAFIRSK